MHEFLLRCVSIQVLPATILLTLALIYWLFVLFGALDLDLFDFDVDVDGEADMNTMLSIGLVPPAFSQPWSRTLDALGEFFCPMFMGAFDDALFRLAGLQAV